jgi:hypothetical protein
VTALATIYLVAVGLDAIGTGIPDRLLSLPARFFVQDAALFPHASADVVEWRVEGWLCNEQRFAEVDVRPLLLGVYAPERWFLRLFRTRAPSVT